MEGHRGLPAGPDGSLDGSTAPGLYASAGPAVKPRRGRRGAKPQPFTPRARAIRYHCTSPQRCPRWMRGGRKGACVRTHDTGAPAARPAELTAARGWA